MSPHKRTDEIGLGDAGSSSTSLALPLPGDDDLDDDRRRLLVDFSSLERLGGGLGRSPAFSSLRTLSSSCSASLASALTSIRMLTVDWMLSGFCDFLFEIVSFFFSFFP